MIEDKKFENLLQISVSDSDRRELYRQAWPKMTLDERVQLLIVLWQMLNEKLYDRVTREMNDMRLREDEGEETYEQRDYDDVQRRVLNEFIASQMHLTDEGEIEELRRELDEIGHKVEEHDQVISKLRPSISDSE